MKQQVLSLVILLVVAAASTAVPAARKQVAPDNSRQNAALIHGATADKQPNDRDDRLTAARVRRVIVADDTLSIYAQNVKIIVAHGNVTLEGPVRSLDERQEIAFDAATIVAASRIVNRVTVT